MIVYLYGPKNATESLLRCLSRNELSSGMTIPKYPATKKWLALASGISEAKGNGKAKVTRKRKGKDTQPEKPSKEGEGHPIPNVDTCLGVVEDSKCHFVWLSMFSF